jgi:hypothetical protein
MQKPNHHECGSQPSLTQEKLDWIGWAPPVPQLAVDAPVGLGYKEGIYDHRVHMLSLGPYNFVIDVVVARVQYKLY